jgi:hypothetical protein
METNSLKDKALLVLISSVAFFSVKFMYMYFKKSKKLSVDDDACASEYSSSKNTSYASFVDGLWQDEDEALEGSITSDSSTDSDLVHTYKNNLYFGMNDEILAKGHLLDTSISSISSYALQTKRVSNKLTKDSREMNAKKFLDKLDKVKSKVIEKRTTLQDYHDQFKESKGFVRIDQDISSELDKSTLKSTGSLNIDSESMLQDEQQETKTLEEKFIKETQRHHKAAGFNKENIKDTKQKVKKNKKKQRTYKNKELNINYNDVNRKDNFIFFEVLAVYADTYLDKSDKNVANLDQKMSKRRLRKDRKRF